MFSKVLIANRGVIACRIIRTLDRLGIGSVAVYSEADRHSLHVSQAREAVLLGPAPPRASYLNIPKVIEAARYTRAQAIHPGYGFLSENAEFAQACEDAGIEFVGPTPAQIRAFGLKHTARELAKANGVPLLPGTGLLESAKEAREIAAAIGFPVILKSTAGGGGIGMRLCRAESEVEQAFQSVVRTSESSFKDSGVYLEKFVERARHIEVQIFGDGVGDVISLGERDCSVQRRNQKVIEETPAHKLPEAVRSEMIDAAIMLGKAVNYRSAGTVEFVYDTETGAFYFLEVNTRLQVEHGVSEEVTSVDIVRWMFLQAAGEMPQLASVKPSPRGHSIQVRVYAEDPGKNFQPAAGLITEAGFPPYARTETWVERGTEITPYYDPLLAKIIVSAETRPQAIAKLRAALDRTHLAGIETNLNYLKQVVASPEFTVGGLTTAFLNTFAWRRRGIEVIDGGTMTTVQDYPGRIGYWNVGVPPSGPMDSLSFRLGNRILGNEDGAAGLECTVTGPSLRFEFEAWIAITGADFGPRLNGRPVPMWKALHIPADSLLELGECKGPGMRACILFHGGLRLPSYLGSASTFTLGGFGGHGGRALRTGDVLHLNDAAPNATPNPDLTVEIPSIRSDWTIEVAYGPHGAPDFFTQNDIDTFFSTVWRVHYNSSRTGIRLIGPKPEWARPDGGEAGLHPSNIHDNAYAIGAIDFTGDMPVILGPDGPSLGGFVCPAVILDDELWKTGQLRPGDSVRFRQRHAEPEVVHRVRDLVCRVSGDRYLLIEFGEPVLDLNLRFRVQELLNWFEDEKPDGIIDLTPGIRSLQIHYDAGKLSRSRVLGLVDRAEAAMPALEGLKVPTRIVRLPLSWDDPATRLAIEKYMKSVRADAPWCPDNIEFIRRINGLDSIEDVKRIVFNASYLVLGLGDVYLGAPVATPLDPRHRLVTTKYNPARTWTAENSVGIGGAYLCIYGMEGPGGYQFVGRTVQMWNTWRTTKEFASGTPWLLRFFDQIRFYPVEAEELLGMRDDFLHGKYHPSIEEEKFSLRDYRAFLSRIRYETKAAKARQQAAFEAERERWKEAGLDREVEAPSEETAAVARALPEGCRAINSPTTGNIWSVSVKQGDRVSQGQRLIILESMKMEIAVSAPQGSTVVEILCKAGSQVAAGQSLMFLRPEAA
ncbi:MAG TPA: 5-oxoprolinase/urea amidolyase family protein [Bryobacteraceae bacterium]|nr:5-oxoprolinase/urea amidolyase family protein [Bryobacteraceae bacterium]